MIIKQKKLKRNKRVKNEYNKGKAITKTRLSSKLCSNLAWGTGPHGSPPGSPTRACNVPID